jgi:hypothetical protein
MPIQHTNTELELKLIKRIDAIEKQNLLLLKQIKKLEARLRAYENAHTPPSKTAFQKTT